MVTFDKTPHSTVAVCQKCGWRTVADRPAARRLAAAHMAAAHAVRKTSDTPRARN